MNIDSIRAYCLSLPSATEDIKWDNDLVFSVGGRMFCVAGLESSTFKCAFKVRDEEFEELITRDAFIPAPYLARAKWVLLSNPVKLNKQQWEQFIAQSYELVKAKLTKKQRSELGID